MTVIKRFRFQGAGGGVLVFAFALAALGAACTGGTDSDATATDLGGAETTTIEAQGQAIDEHDDLGAADQAHEDAGPDHAVADAGQDETDEDHGLTHEAADAHEVERTITVIAEEFTFGQQEIHVRVGETVRLVLQNAGAVFHDITAPDFAGEADVQAAEHHETTMEGMGDVAFHAAADAGEVAELVFVATQAGRYDLLCTVPGHAQLGMTAVLVVEA